MMGVNAVIRDTGEVVEIGSHGIDLPGRVSQVGLELPDSLSFEQWEGIGHSLQGVERSLMWWIGDWLHYGEQRYGDKYEKAIEATGKSYQTLINAKNVAVKFAEFNRRRLDLSWAHHAEVAALPPDAADRLLDHAERENWKRAELRRHVNQAKNAAKFLGSKHFDGGTCTVKDLFGLIEQRRRFGCIYADPPWQYDNQSTRAATDNHYETMTIDDICALPIEQLAADEAHLHLWTTNAFLFECPRIFEAWGFEFRSTFVWVKPQIGIGNYWRNAHEILLTAVRGDAKRFNDKTLKSWLECRRSKHSEKPDRIRDFLKRTSPGPRLELFGRREMDDWVVWGKGFERSLFDKSVQEFAA